ncbi:MAG TPA: hypothetical protein VFQ59_00200 [Candidatus Paceibacterota bacterium]|nr:hypothetical protein [Candidatus Paceibacterota bacterium]
MVMYRHGIPLLPVELLGYHLGLILGKEYRHLFWNVRTGKRPKAGYGTSVDENEKSLNSLFKKLKIPLKVKEHRIESFLTKNHLIDFLQQKINDGKDLIVFLASDVLNNSNNKNGHACVIDRIYVKRGIVRLIDPSPVHPKWREIKFDKFIKAIKQHPAGNGRILEIESK